MIEAKLTGIKDYTVALRSIVPKLRRRALMKALRAAARPVRETARAATPVLSAFTVAPYRKPGTVKKAIAVRTSKLARKKGDVGVFVNVRPAKGGARGAKNPDDPFYWRFLEFGTKHIRKFEFLQRGGKRLPQSLAIFEAVLSGELAKLERNGKDPL